MSKRLRQEIKQRRPLASLEQEVFLNVLHTADVRGGAARRWDSFRVGGAFQPDFIFPVKFECEQAGNFLGEVPLLQICCPQKC